MGVASRPRHILSDGGGPSGSDRNGAVSTSVASAPTISTRCLSGAAKPLSNWASSPPGKCSWPMNVRSTPRSSNRAKAWTRSGSSPAIRRARLTG
jgi:hypothetical protein